MAPSAEFGALSGPTKGIAQQTLFIARFVQLVDQGGGSGEADRETLLACCQT